MRFTHSFSPETEGGWVLSTPAVPARSPRSNQKHKINKQRVVDARWRFRSGTGPDELLERPLNRYGSPINKYSALPPDVIDIGPRAQEGEVFSR